MPAKTTSRPTFRCTECGRELAKWVGQCPNCREWNTVEEAAPVAPALSKVTAGAPSTRARPIAEVDLDSARAVATGIGELLHTTSVRHAFGMIRRGVADPVELTLAGDDIVPTALELTRELSGAWVEGEGRRSVGFSYRAVHERDHWTCAYCGRSVSKTPPCSALLATVELLRRRRRADRIVAGQRIARG